MKRALVLLATVCVFTFLLESTQVCRKREKGCFVVSRKNRQAVLTRSDGGLARWHKYKRRSMQPINRPCWMITTFTGQMLRIGDHHPLRPSPTSSGTMISLLSLRTTLTDAWQSTTAIATATTRKCLEKLRTSVCLLCATFMTRHLRIQIPVSFVTDSLLNDESYGDDGAPGINRI